MLNCTWEHFSCYKGPKWCKARTKVKTSWCRCPVLKYRLLNGVNNTRLYRQLHIFTPTDNLVLKDGYTSEDQIPSIIQYTAASIENVLKGDCPKTSLLENLAQILNICLQMCRYITSCLPMYNHGLSVKKKREVYIHHMLTICIINL